MAGRKPRISPEFIMSCFVMSFPKAIETFLVIFFPQYSTNSLWDTFSNILLYFSVKSLLNMAFVVSPSSFSTNGNSRSTSHSVHASRWAFHSFALNVFMVKCKRNVIPLKKAKELCFFYNNPLICFIPLFLNLCHGLLQDCGISIANGLEILQSCSKPWPYPLGSWHIVVNHNTILKMLH